MVGAVVADGGYAAARHKGSGLQSHGSRAVW
jgi:hypothetical protein